MVHKLRRGHEVWCGVGVLALDQMAAFAIETLLARDRDATGSLVRRMAQRWPDQPALAVVFAITQAAAHIEDNLDEGRATDGAALVAYRLAAVIAADVFALQAMGQAAPVARDLLHFWRRVDGYFTAV